MSRLAIFRKALQLEEQLAEARNRLAYYEPNPSGERMYEQTTRAPERDERASAVRQAASGVVPAEQNPLTVLEQGLEEARKRVSDQTERVRQLVDHLFGSEPERGAANGNKEMPPRIGRTGAILDQSEALHRALEYLDIQLDRLAPLAR